MKERGVKERGDKQIMSADTVTLKASERGIVSVSGARPIKWVNINPSGQGTVPGTVPVP